MIAMQGESPLQKLVKLVRLAVKRICRSHTRPLKCLVTRPYNRNHDHTPNVERRVSELFIDNQHHGHDVSE